MIAKTATNPLDRIRMLSQTGEHGGGANHSIVGLYRSILRHEGILGLWAGNGANLLRVFPSKAIVFSSNDVYTSWLKHITGTETYSSVLSFCAGGMSGMSATAATYPLDLARGRITGKLAPDKAYRGVLQTISMTVREEGIMALYKGALPTLLGAMPYEGIKFGTVGVLEIWFPPVKEHDSDNSSTKSSPLRKMCMGGMGGIMAGLITYPNDTIRRLLQLQGSRGTETKFTGYFDCMRKTYAQHGITRFYRGVGLNIVRMAPNTAVQFGSYEILKNLTSEML